jgi:hypothetical protein
VLLASGVLLLLLAAIRDTPATMAVRSDGLPRATAPQDASSFPAQVAALSEPGGYFDTDNLISNERSYLQVVSDLRRAKVQGGAYLGVGPDTNFSYIAAVRPSVAFIIDVRRDNLLLHLLFKTLFTQSATRVEYLSLLLGRRQPPSPEGWRSAPIDRIAEHFDRAAPLADLAGVRQKLDAALNRIGVPLSADDLATIHRFHQRFVDDGLELRFNSSGRAPQAYYPTYRELLLETDADGQRVNYLASEDAFQFVKSLHAADRIVPVVGDLGGPTALAAIGRTLGARRERVTAFYTYLRQLPHSDRGVIIRSVFGRYTGFGRPGDASTSHLQPIGELLAGLSEGRFRSYGELVVKR